MRRRSSRSRLALASIGTSWLWCALALSLSWSGPARAEIFKWVDEGSVVHYTTNRASIPIKFQDTVKIVETPPAAPPPVMREAELPPLPGPLLGEEELPPPRQGTSDVTGRLLEPAPAPPAEAAPRTRTASIAPSSALTLKSFSGKSEGWWRAQFYQQHQTVDRQQKIVDTHRTRLRQIIKSHAGGEQVLPLEDDPDFQKMADVLPREENRLNQIKRNFRRLEARADQLRIPESWRE